MTDNPYIPHGFCIRPGKFEGEPTFVPYFWDMVLAGDSTPFGHPETGEVDDIIEIVADDKKHYPRLNGFSHIALWESESGFVYHLLLTPGDYQTMVIDGEELF